MLAEVLGLSLWFVKVSSSRTNIREIFLLLHSFYYFFWDYLIIISFPPLLPFPRSAHIPLLAWMLFLALQRLVHCAVILYIMTYLYKAKSPDSLMMLHQALMFCCALLAVLCWEVLHLFMTTQIYNFPLPARTVSLFSLLPFFHVCSWSQVNADLVGWICDVSFLFYFCGIIGDKLVWLFKSR